MAEAGGDDREVCPGMVSVVQTATDLLEWSPHVHALGIVAFILDPQVVTKILRHIASSDTARERAPPTSALAS